MYKKLARGLSWVLHPFLLPLYMLLTLLFADTLFAHYPASVKGYLVWVVVLYTIMIPALMLGVLRRAGRLTDYNVDRRSERILPLAVGTVCCLLCAVTVAKIPSAMILRKFMLAAACCEAMCLLVSLRWKISLHLTGMGALCALLTILNIAGFGQLMGALLVAVAASGLLASARLALGCHNGLQILAGFAGGFAIAASVVLFL